MAEREGLVPLLQRESTMSLTTVIVAATPLTWAGDNAGNNLLARGTFNVRLENATDYVKFDLLNTNIVNATGPSVWVGAATVSNLTAIPEPSPAALLGLGGLALMLRRRK